MEHNQLNALKPTTKLEKYGFYAYAFGSEPYVATAAAVCMPIILETLTASAGYALDGITPCDIRQTNYKCQVQIAGILIDSTSFVLFITSISVAIQALIFVGLSSLADHGDLKKKLLVTSACIGASFTILILTVTDPSYYWLAALFYICSNVGFGASYVFYYAYISILTQNDPEVLEAYSNPSSTTEEIISVSEKVGNTLSSYGFAWGYVGAVITLLLSVGIIISFGQNIYSLQMACAMCGLWWLLFTYVTSALLQTRPGPPLPESESYILYAWKQFYKTIRLAPQMGNLFTFLASWFMISDGLGTVVSIAILFGKVQLGFTQIELLILAMITPIMASLGCIFWMFIQRNFELKIKSVLLLLMGLYLLLPLYGILGIYTSFGLRTKLDMFVLGAYHGFLIGAIQSFYRVMFSGMVPRGKETEFFGLYEITDKGSSWIGPFMVGGINAITHKLNNGFYFILISILVPIILMFCVDVEKGRRQSLLYEEIASFDDSVKNS